MSKVLTLAGVSVLALTLVLGMAVPALAVPDSAPSSIDDLDGALITGEVFSIGDQEFVIQSGEEELTIVVDDDTLYYQLSMPDRVMAWLQQRLQVRQQYQEELKAQEENGHGQGQGLKNRLRATVSARNQVRFQNQLAQTEGMLQTELLCCRWLRNFSDEAEFGDIAVGDSVVVWLAEGDNLAQGVMIIESAD